MSTTRNAIFVIGPTTAHDARWNALSHQRPDLAITRVAESENLTAFVAGLLAQTHMTSATFILPEVWLSPDFGDAIAAVCSELDRLCDQNWGMASNRGVRWDGLHVYQYVRQPPRNPQTGLSPKPVISCGGAVFVLNLAAMRAARVVLPRIDHTSEFFVALGVSLLSAALPIFADHRLMAAYFPDNLANNAAPSLPYSSQLKRFLSAHILNHSLATTEGPLLIDTASDFTYLRLPKSGSARPDLISLFDNALRRARVRKLKLDFAIRSCLDRDHLLERAVRSCVGAAIESSTDLEINIRVITNAPEQEVSRISQEFSLAFPVSKISVESFQLRPNRFSRTDLLLQAVESSQADFIWFIDDDDFVFPGAVNSLARTVLAPAAIAMFGDCRTFEERWRFNATLGRQTLTHYEPRDLLRAAGVLKSFQGENHIPICGMILPLELMKQQLSGVQARGDYLEDYFVLLRLLVAPLVEIEILPHTFAGISLRGNENTVRTRDRSPWNQSYAAFLHEILASEQAVNPLLWQIGGPNDGPDGGIA